MDYERRTAEDIAESVILVNDEDDTRYFVAFGDEPEQEVTKKRYMAVERAAGFTPKLGPGHIATASFSASFPYSGQRVRGRTQPLGG